MKRLDQVKDELEEFDRVATGDATLRIEWDFDRHSRFIGSFSSGAVNGRAPTIELNYPTIERWFRTRSQAQAMRRLTGLNFHELGHALFTPSDVKEGLPNEGWFFNTLEDQRVERLIIARYPDSRTCLEELLRSGDVLGAVLAHGRSYISSADRRFLDRQFARAYGQPALGALVEIIDTYVAFEPGTSREVLNAQAVRLHDLMVDIGAYVPRFDDTFDHIFSALH